MPRIRVIPCLLLRNRALVKTVKFSAPGYIGDPINTVRIFNEKEVDELIVLDILATRENRPPQFDLIAEIAGECFMPLTYGGGVRSIDDMKRLFRSGIEKIAVNSAAARNPSFIKEAAAYFGSQSIIASIDVRKTWLKGYQVFSDNGRKKVKSDPANYAALMENMGAGEILLNAIDRDGTFSGFDLQLIRHVSERVGIPVIAAGGAGSIDDLCQAVETGKADAVAMGSMVVYQGRHRAVMINFPTPDQLACLLSFSGTQ